MTYRMAIALTSLVNALVAAYLHLWKLGLVGTLACTSSGGCELVQGSRYGWFLGVDVALIGAVGWTVVFLVALFGTSPAREDDPRVTKLLGALVGTALGVRRLPSGGILKALGVVLVIAGLKLILT